ncbi:MAG: PKD domain-containing protein [Thermoplasmata archaeon]|nr:PKD domain-containing protein [Thermoplasmata archaeon]
MAAAHLVRSTPLRRWAVVLLAILLALPFGLGSLGTGAPGPAALTTGVPCDACRAGVAPRQVPAAAAIDWQNVTPEQFGNLPPAAVGAVMVDDGNLQEFVWFGGCQDAGCTGNGTWLLQNGTWRNDSAGLSLAPPPRAGAMSEFFEPTPPESANGSVLVFGGAEPGPGGSDVLGNDTWVFRTDGWHNSTSQCDRGPSDCVPALSHGSLAYDPAANVSLLFGGCVSTPSCTTFEGESWEFDANLSTWAALNISGPSARFGAAMAYDPVLRANVLFGGTGECGRSDCTQSDTWLYNASGWSNATASIGGVAPPARALGSLTWDPARQELLLSGGSATPGGVPSTSTFALVCSGSGSSCNWTGPLFGSGPGLVGAAVPSNTSGADPISLGGATGSGAPTNATFVYAALPDLNVAVAPAPQEVGRSVYLNASAVASVDPTFRFLWGDGTSDVASSGNGVHVFAAAGVYNATIGLTDPNGSANIHSLQLFVHGGPSATITVSYPGVDVGVRDVFTAAPVEGTGTTPYNVTWSFGSGSVEYGASVARTFSLPGNVTVTASLVDALGLHGSAVTNVTVAPDPTVTIVPEFSVGGRAVADAGVSTTLLANVVGGTAPDNFTWQFGDGDSGFGPGPIHSFTTGPVVRTVSVTVADAGGFTAPGTLNVSVAATPVITGVATTPSLPTAGTTVTFVPATTGGVGGASFVWTYGDGSSGTGHNGTHSYTSAGTYTVIAWWNDSAGGSAARTLNLTIGPSVSLLTGFLLNPVVLSALIIVAAAATALLVRYRQRPAPVGVPPAESPPPTGTPPAEP